ncbi:MAG: argininosuccinate lyase [Candidatus Omnitrophota bacterium]
MAKKLWGGRFSKKAHPLTEEFTKSISFDYKLLHYDIAGSLAHVGILKSAGIISAVEAAKISQGLKSIKFDSRLADYQEDVHTFIQNQLHRRIGKLALKLHTARSRNDQVVFSTKMYCKDNLKKLIQEIDGFSSALGTQVKKQAQLILPGFTHLQHAQPVYLKDYLNAYALMLNRDKKRLELIQKNEKATLGAGALAGTPIAALKYAKFATANSLDAVSNRDFVLEIISALSILAMHLSRLAEDLIIWSTKEFDFVEIDEAFCTGSSLMPQKKNPDVLELVRGYAGRLYGNLVSVLTMMKGLPLTYNRDMQLDKEPLFDSFEIVSRELKVLTGLIETLKFNEKKIKEHLKDESLYATDLVYYLVDRKIPFKEAHTAIGKLVKYSLDHGIQIKDMPESLLNKFSNKIVKKEIIKLFDPLVSVRSKKSIKRK